MQVSQPGVVVKDIVHRNTATIRQDYRLALRGGAIPTESYISDIERMNAQGEEEVDLMRQEC